MIQTVAGIWLFLLTFGAGFITGRIYRGTRRGGKMTPLAQPDNFGWQELLNFLQYDGSGRMPTSLKERGGKSDEEQYNSGANSARVRTRRPL